MTIYYDVNCEAQGGLLISPNCDDLDIILKLCAANKLKQIDWPSTLALESVAYLEDKRGYKTQFKFPTLLSTDVVNTLFKTSLNLSGYPSQCITPDFGKMQGVDKRVDTPEDFVRIIEDVTSICEPQALCLMLGTKNVRSLYCVGGLEMAKVFGKVVKNLVTVGNTDKHTVNVRTEGVVKFALDYFDVQVPELLKQKEQEGRKQEEPEASTAEENSNKNYTIRRKR